MRYLIKAFADVYLVLSRSKFTGNTLDCDNQLSDGRSPFPESMLFICQNILMIEMPHGVAAYAVFQDLTSHRGKGNVR